MPKYQRRRCTRGSSPAGWFAGAIVAGAIVARRLGGQYFKVCDSRPIGESFARQVHRLSPERHTCEIG